MTKPANKCEFAGCLRHKVEVVVNDNYTQLGLCEIHIKEAKKFLSKH